MRSVRISSPGVRSGPRAILTASISSSSSLSALTKPGISRLLSSPREHHGYIYGGVVRGQGQQEPPLSLLQSPRQPRRERATAAASPPPPSPPSSRDAPRAPPAPSSPPPRRQATLCRAAAAEQQRGLQHTGTAAQQDEGVKETQTQDGPRWATPPLFSIIPPSKFEFFSLSSSPRNFSIISDSAFSVFSPARSASTSEHIFTIVRLLGAIYTYATPRTVAAWCFKRRGARLRGFPRPFREWNLARRDRNF